MKKHTSLYNSDNENNDLVFPLDVHILMKVPRTGCFIEGTEILLESGVSKPIEQLKVGSIDNPTAGDTLLSVDGVRTFVVAKFAGLRENPYVRLKARPMSADHNRKLLDITVSMNHTFAVSFSKIVPAAYLVKGQSVRTIFGEALVEDIVFSDEERQVWNVYLASEKFVTDIYSKYGMDMERLLMFLFNSSLGLSAKQHLMFGNGFLSGDLYLQTHTDEIISSGVHLNELT